MLLYSGEVCCVSVDNQNKFNNMEYLLQWKQKLKKQVYENTRSQEFFPIQRFPETPISSL